jgi:hypothetical protein
MNTEAEESTSSLLNSNVRRIIDDAKKELRELIEQRAAITRRIATTKRTIAGLANVFGDAALQAEALEFMDERRYATNRQSGLTQGCRLLLMETKGAISRHELCEKLQLNDRGLASRHKSLISAMTTVLNRLVNYGEVRASEVNGKRAWEWIRDKDVEPTIVGDLPPIHARQSLGE